jgi:hypothetical protein
MAIILGKAGYCYQVIDSIKSTDRIQRIYNIKENSHVENNDLIILQSK